MLGLYFRRITTAGVFSGLSGRAGIVGFLVLATRDPFMGWNAGFIGLCRNFAVTTAISLLRPAEQHDIEKNFPMLFLDEPCRN
jgi:solute:Na+ symporter, SSS family